ncbi:MAG TPA: hypothetical protein VLK85_06845, partial [Ramlibacter sp.]|nr:hypothetical protein [Ramlibacter sp.]
MAKRPRICLVEMAAAVDAAGTVETLRYGNHPFVTEPADTPANTYYMPRVTKLGTVVREMFAGEKTAGRSRIGYGDIELQNLDGALDDIRGYSFGNRQLVVRTGYTDDAFGDLVESLVATASGVELTTRGITVQLKDRQSELDKPLQATLFAGTNALPAGVEGVDDLEGKPKPRTYGWVGNISPPCINTSRLIYQVNDGAVASIAVYDGGVALTAGATYA